MMQDTNILDEKSQARLTELLNTDFAPQRSQAWFRQREKRITSSRAAGCLPRTKEIAGPWVDLFNVEDFTFDERLTCSNYVTFYDFYKSSVNPVKFKGNEATYFGQKYEQVMTNFYSNLTGKKVYELGLVQHPTIECMASSADGLTEDGIVLEIKCPKSRKINNVVPLEYWIQVQFHLHCTGMQYCDFLEATIKEYESYYEWKECYDEGFSGVLVQIEKIPDNAESREFIYRDPDSKDDVQNWLLKTSKKVETLENSIVKSVFYKIQKTHMFRIERDDVWLTNALPFLQEALEKLQWYKENPEQVDIEACLFTKIPRDVPNVLDVPEPLEEPEEHNET